MEKNEWYDIVAKKICDNIEEFYEKFYNSAISKVGRDYRINPCPMCGHNECCTVSAELNSVNCFSGSCGWHGSHINTWLGYCTQKLNMSIGEGIQRLEQFAGYPFPVETDEEYEKYQKKQIMLSIAEGIYHKELMCCEDYYHYEDKFRNIDSRFTPLEYLLNIRKRSKANIEKMKVGFASKNAFFEIRNKLLSMGFTSEEIKEAKIWIPEGVFIYPYRHPNTNDIVRINTKNPFLSHFTGDGKGDVIKGYSVGDKFLYFAPGFSFKKDYVIFVEGENDVAALVEKGETQVVGTGGTIRLDGGAHQLNIIYKMPDDVIIYTMYDNDESGEKYTNITNDFFADRTVKRIKYGEDNEDPDEYFKRDLGTKMNELMDLAVPLETDATKIRHRGNEWSIATRTRRLEFTLSSKNKSGSFVGRLAYYESEKIIFREDDVALIKCKVRTHPLNFYLLDEIEKYYNELVGKKPGELIAIYRMSSKKEEIISSLAHYIYEKNSDENVIQELKLEFKKHKFNMDDMMDMILKEVNDIRNNDISLDNIPRMRVGQYFNIRNGDAYFYFTYVKVDGDVKRKLPYLLRNDGQIIRLDLLKRKDEQCLLLVDNKYELSQEINKALLDINQCSLTQKWVEEYKSGNIPDDELDPGKLVRRIEWYIRKFYYTADQSIYKVLALFIYCTYYYEALDQIPYLYLNGQKGSGKSQLDNTIELLAFNAKMALDITDAAIFRMLEIEGGTLILDELEGLTSKVARTGDSTLAGILKGGYSKNGGSIYRVNADDRAIVDNFNCYGPKVISNINGMDDVIESRCIIVTSYPLRLTKDNKPEDPKYYKNNRLEEVRELTSKCCLSALRCFKKLHEIYDASLFETNNARVTQILTPLLAIAKLCDEREVQEIKRINPDVIPVGEYEKGLTDYWNNTLKKIKEETEKDTPEGIIRQAVTSIAHELWGNVSPKDREFSIANNHKYNEPIIFNKEEGWFEINAIHFKCFIEEVKPGETAYARYIPRWVKTSFNFEAGDIKRRIVNIENEELMKEFKGNMKPKVHFFRFYFKDFITIDDTFLDEKQLPKKDNSEDSLF